MLKWEVWNAASVITNMNKNIKKYWKSEIELTNSSKVESLRNNEFVEKLPVDDILSDKKSLENSNTCLLYTSPSPRDDR